MSTAKPLTYTERRDRYSAQNGTEQLTSRQERRLEHKDNRAFGRMDPSVAAALASRSAQCAHGPHAPYRWNQLEGWMSRWGGA